MVIYESAMATTRNHCERLLKEAVLGNAEAQFELGVQILRLDASGRSLEQAVHWLNRAKENGHLEAQAVIEAMEGVARSCLFMSSAIKQVV